MEDEALFYVGVKDPSSLRRELLESSKLVVQLLQRYEKFKLLKAEKAEEVARLKKIVDEINSLFFKLKAELPKTKLRSKIPEEEAEGKHKKVKKGKEIKEPIERPKKTDIDDLDAQLKEIESRLGNLS